MDIQKLGFAELTSQEQAAIDGGADGYEWGLSVGRFIRSVGEAIGEALENYENPKYNGTWQG